MKSNVTCRHLSAVIILTVLCSCGPRSLIKITDEFNYGMAPVSGGTAPVITEVPAATEDPQENPPVFEIPVDGQPQPDCTTLIDLGSKAVLKCSDGSIIIDDGVTPPSPLVKVITGCGVKGNETWLQFQNGEVIGDLTGEEIFFEQIGPGIQHTIHETHCRYTVVTPSP